MIVIKRDGRELAYDESKIIKSITNAANDPKANVIIPSDKLEEIISHVNEKVTALNKDKIPVEKIQDIIEASLYNAGLRKVRDSYHDHREGRTEIRDFKSDLMKVIDKIGIETDRDNANVGNNFSSKLLRIASESNKWHNLAMMPKPMAKLHENGDIYYHDLDSLNLTTNCLHIPTGKVLSRGFNTGYGSINKPKRIESAAELSCILLQATQNDMFGGQSHPNFDNDMAIFVQPTRKEIFDEETERFLEIKGANYIYTLNENNEPKIDEFNLKRIQSRVENKVRKSVDQAMQGIVYNLNTMHSRAGSQVPFSSVNIGLPDNEDAALVCESFLLQYEKGLGKGEQPIFPNIIFRVKKGVNRDPGDPYYYLFKLACKVAGKRMNPTFMNMDADFNLKYYEKGIKPATMGCRTYICSNINGQEGPEGRGNIAPTTINLVRLGIRAAKEAEELYKGSEEEVLRSKINCFFNFLDERLKDARDSLLYRYDLLKNLRVKDLPFVAGQGLMLGSEGLDPNDSIEPVLKQGSWSIGFIGLAETLTALIGKHHGEDEYARDLGESIIKHIRDFTDKTTEETHLNWSCYATPAEGLSGRFVPQDRAKFGIIPGVTDKDYYTNSYHVPVGYKISIKDKIAIEAPYHKLCNAGHISYIELDDYPQDDTIEDIVRYAYENTNISYIGINFHIRYCKDCGTYLHGEESCPSCGSKNIQGISRVTGYLSLDERFGVGKSAERADRTSHDHQHKKLYHV